MSCLTPKELTDSNFMPREKGYHLKLYSLSKEFVSSQRSSLSFIHLRIMLLLLPGQIANLNRCVFLFI